MPLGHLAAPCDDVGSGDGREPVGIFQANEGHEISDVIAVGAPGVGVFDVGQPFQQRWDVAQSFEVGGI
jgi:hypothetical protein